MNLAIKDIQHNIGRFILTVLGIGLLLMIVMGMAGIYRGLIEDATLLVERIDADLWIVQKDTRGPYAEVSRIQNNSNRLHGTFGLDINPYFVNTGVGTDYASGYRNWVATIGVDLVRTARTFGIIPPDPVPAYDRFFPPPFVESADGLPDGFTIGQKKSTAPPNADDVKNIVTDIPKKLAEKFGTPEQVAESKNDTKNELKKEQAEKKHKIKRRRR